MPFRIEVISHIASLCGVDGVVSTHRTVLAREPLRSALSEDNAAGDNIFTTGFLRTEPLPSRITGVSVCSTLGGVRGVTDIREREEEFRDRRRCGDGGSLEE
jgi:hypothetical protein